MSDQADVEVRPSLERLTTILDQLEKVSRELEIAEGMGAAGYDFSDRPDVHDRLDQLARETEAVARRIRRILRSRAPKTDEPAQ